MGFYEYLFAIVVAVAILYGMYLLVGGLFALIDWIRPFGKE
jgi:hypothetical protein